MADPLDGLFSLPLEEFTAARNKLGADFKHIPKPSVPAWTVNQLARQHADAMKRLVEAGQEQARALKAGAGMREAQAAERNALAELTRAARKVLEGSGRKATTQTLDRVAATLIAGVQTDEGRKALLGGRLTEELEPAGFGALAGISPAPQARDELAERRREKEQRARKKRKLQDEARELEAKARAAEREADRAEAAADKARTAADKARRRAGEAAEALRELD